MPDTQTQTPNANYRQDPVPLWIYGISLVVLGILGWQVISALFAPAWAYPTFEGTPTGNANVLVTLAGRNIVMMALTVMAMRTRSAMFLAYTFLMHLIRETWDMGMVAFFNGLSAADLLRMLSFLLFIVPYMLALRVLRGLAAVP